MVGDIDNDGFLEIIAGLWYNNVEIGGMVAIENDGCVKWKITYIDGTCLQSRQFDFWWGGFSIVDLEGDG